MSLSHGTAAREKRIPRLTAERLSGARAKRIKKAPSGCQRLEWMWWPVLPRRAIQITRRGFTEVNLVSGLPVSHGTLWRAGQHPAFTTNSTLSQALSECLL